MKVPEPNRECFEEIIKAETSPKGSDDFLDRIFNQNMNGQYLY